MTFMLRQSVLKIQGEGQIPVAPRFASVERHVIQPLLVSAPKGAGVFTHNETPIFGSSLARVDLDRAELVHPWVG